ncbi:MAG: helix-turn-helix domain-containing protein [Pyrinomonadaceae bacterium]
MDPRVQTVISLMKERLHQGCSANSLASHVNLSPSRLHQVFKVETGLPPARFLRRLRMEQSRELLETSYLSVKEVMARVGVADGSHFVRDFKKTFGCSPAKYRERFLSARPAEEIAPDSHPAPAHGASQMVTEESANEL